MHGYTNTQSKLTKRRTLEFSRAIKFAARQQFGQVALAFFQRTLIIIVALRFQFAVADPARQRQRAARARLAARRCTLRPPRFTRPVQRIG